VLILTTRISDLERQCGHYSVEAENTYFCEIVTSVFEITHAYSFIAQESLANAKRATAVRV